MRFKWTSSTFKIHYLNVMNHLIPQYRVRHRQFFTAHNGALLIYMSTIYHKKDWKNTQKKKNLGKKHAIFIQPFIQHYFIYIKLTSRAINLN